MQILESLLQAAATDSYVLWLLGALGSCITAYLLARMIVGISSRMERRQEASAPNRVLGPEKTDNEPPAGQLQPVAPVAPRSMATATAPLPFPSTRVAPTTLLDATKEIGAERPVLSQLVMSQPTGRSILPANPVVVGAAAAATKSATPQSQPATPLSLLPATPGKLTAPSAPAPAGASPMRAPVPAAGKNVPAAKPSPLLVSLAPPGKPLLPNTKAPGATTATAAAQIKLGIGPPIGSSPQAAASSSK